ncbi:MAG: cation transport regulator ChaB [Gammaproteobacteria bacterium RIFCSPHIGHO2_12_FULL_35_23]|nr:MAG: cation transport regulator ChaB [Gammaproteobacteria bacterium RIFCSPHIGHO2_12_FULL_35_23]
MPYNSVNDLPNNIKDNLLLQAQKIYQKAFNNAWEQFKEAKKRCNNSSQEEVSHKVAWSAVEKKYHKSPQGK